MASANKVGKNDIPGVDELKCALVAALASGRSRDFAAVGKDIARDLGLSRAQRAYRIGQSKASLFENRLGKARAELTKEGAITYKNGKVKLAAGARPDEPPKAARKKSPSKPKRQQSMVLDAPGTFSAPPAVDLLVSTIPPAPGAPEGRPTKCLSFQNPYGVCIALGLKSVECRSRKIRPMKNLVVCASKTANAWCPMPGLPYGYAIGLVDVVDCVPFRRAHLESALMSFMPGEDEYAWVLENPRLIKPFPVKASASFFYVSDIPEVIPATRESYEDFVLPIARHDDPDLTGLDMADILFSGECDLWDFFGF